VGLLHCIVHIDPSLVSYPVTSRLQLPEFVAVHGISKECYRLHKCFAAHLFLSPSLRAFAGTGRFWNELFDQHEIRLRHDGVGGSNPFCGTSEAIAVRKSRLADRSDDASGIVHLLRK
jgi:hypothetical protein